MDIHSSNSLFLTVLILFFHVNLFSCATNVIATAPVNPVEKGGILSVRCQVWDLDNSHDVTMLRTVTNGEIQRLFLGEDVPSRVGERVFLAVRNLGDGSVVYFLSIIHVKRDDEGLYTCSVRAKSTGSQIAVSSLQMNISYFPSDSDPECSDIPSIVHEGTLLTLNCSSEEGFPRVSLNWRRAGTEEYDELKPISYISKDNRIYATHTIRVGMNDHNTVFLCTISSKEFPSLSPQCHVGPLKVMSKSGVIPYDDVAFESTKSVTSNVKGQGKDSESSYDKPIRITPSIKQNCDEVCAELSSKMTFYWVIATVVGFCIAMLFLILVIVLLFRYLKLKSYKDNTYVAALPTHEKVYAELDNRRTDNKVYMTLEKNDNLLRQKYMFQSDIPDHYQTNPRRLTP